MEEKHPIDKLFRDGLSQTNIPFDEGAWTTLSRKMRPRKRWPLLIGIGSGIAAAMAIATILLFGERELEVARPEHHAVSQQPVAPPQPEIPTPGVSASVDATDSAVTGIKLASTPVVNPRPTGVESALAPTPVRLQELTTTTFPNGLYLGPQRVTIALPTRSLQKPYIPTDNQPFPTIRRGNRGWTLGIIAAPDLSGTQPFRGKLSGNLGLMATYRLNGWISISAGVLYAKKIYQADFADYRPAGNPLYAQYTPMTVDADCNVLDIPVNINIDIARQQRATWFASTGISSYLMLKETYDYTYPPHQYGDLEQLTLRNQNRHILGIANLSVGYRRQLGGAVSLTVQPFVKVPLTGIGNGKLKLYSSGVALSADVDLTRRVK
ncbi:hypothetical protein [Parapedobacter sp. 10938]|uniref:hypothetical protein n=1 Tax=Parapedobacter flavus TaxID=3110225 RepID=UPI002DB79A23|nr:hypothetical protein [Parapedobacter sp. 10938]MEC3880537.1 hypothetical protein [Parapedobacter sp. 10938]